MKAFTKLVLAAAILLSSMLAVPVGEVRAAEQKQPAYVASAKRDPFHKPTCGWAGKILPENLQTFKNRQEAIDAGHRPCKICKP